MGEDRGYGRKMLSLELAPLHLKLHLPYNNSVNHLAAGYEIDEEGNVILIVKNSWGHKWGIHGYIFLKGGTSYRRGVLGVNLDVLYPIVCDYITPLTLELSKMGRVYTRHPDILTSSPPRILTPADFPQKVITPDGVPEYTFAECEEWRLPVPVQLTRAEKDWKSKSFVLCQIRTTVSFFVFDMSQILLPNGNASCLSRRHGAFGMQAGSRESIGQRPVLSVLYEIRMMSKMGRVYTRHPDILTFSPPRILTPADFPQKVITPEGVPEYTPDECEEWRLPFADSKEMGSKVNEYIEGGCLPLLVSPDRVLNWRKLDIAL
ncbi:hypothetical protein RJ640_013221 [Escallonia rubra]|uniref:Peptidase C1A papain C-terminal domain-containing protein n=1 Tax=Escallonia rubra TaxID=112253 RepID=A0AA88RG99_9ASTE|nr:hypothetical protein RJ640_013221 [Escallonia rubra]